MYYQYKVKLAISVSILDWIKSNRKCDGILLVLDAQEISLTAYMIGKFGVTVTFVIIYVLTSEMFPTTTRQSYMGACSTFGRLGVMVAPQMPLLVSIFYCLLFHSQKHRQTVLVFLLIC